jgi:hypothetical protein
LQLTVLSGPPSLRGGAFDLAPGRPIRIGRDPGAKIRLTSPIVQRWVCQVSLTAHGAWVRDLRSHLGTIRNCRPVRPNVEEPLLPGDVLGVPGLLWLRLGPAVVIDPGWLHWNDGAVARLSRQIGDGRDHAALPVLADALEEAGCTDADLLRHCRSGTSHYRICWVVCLLLGRLTEVS